MSIKQKESGNIIRWIRNIRGSEVCFRTHGMPFYMYKDFTTTNIAVHIFENCEKVLLFSGYVPYGVIRKTIYDKNDVSSHKSFWLNGASRKN